LLSVPLASATNYLEQGGTYSTVSSVSAANPTASLGLAAVNGSAGTFLRSDGAPALDQSIAPTWTGVHQFTDGKFQLKGSSSGTTTLKAAATAGTTTITLPGATTDFSATGGTSQVVKQTSSGGAFSVARLACADLSDSSTGCSGAASASAANPTATISGTAVNGSASTFLRSDGAPALGTAAKTRQITFSFDGNGAALVTGNSLPVVVPFACTISAYSISVAVADTGTFKLWRVATGTAIPTSGNSISTSGVAISTGTHVRSTTVSDFTSTAIAADDILIGQLSAVGGTTTGAVFNIECTI